MVFAQFCLSYLALLTPDGAPLMCNIHTHTVFFTYRNQHCLAVTTTTKSTVLAQTKRRHHKEQTPHGGTERDLLDSSSSDNGSLFDPIFDNAQKVLKETSSSRKKKEKPLKAASLKHARNDEATSTSARPVRQQQDQDDNERVKEIGE